MPLIKSVPSFLRMVKLLPTLKICVAGKVTETESTELLSKTDPLTISESLVPLGTVTIPIPRVVNELRERLLVVRAPTVSPGRIEPASPKTLPTLPAPETDPPETVRLSMLEKLSAKVTLPWLITMVPRNVLPVLETSLRPPAPFLTRRSLA